MKIIVEIPVITWENINGEIVPCSHNAREEEIYLTDEQILAIGDRYRELREKQGGKEE